MNISDWIGSLLLLPIITPRTELTDAKCVGVGGAGVWVAASGMGVGEEGMGVGVGGTGVGVAFGGAKVGVTVGDTGVGATVVGTAIVVVVGRTDADGVSELAQATTSSATSVKLNACSSNI